ncbi:MAG: UDP-N-acetylmuramoyl-L-alanyl-D-glutamate--2,6-diaminopimelate ligase [Lentisphaerae bacterium ADurb.Bin242]|nr:MAG: UDP-N-acetylmuramoyl-L-alanyl-D-glutamate--2,6-diaminopimelate ligase [Lentisphaerae bacterium ADurb.Bin242]
MVLPLAAYLLPLRELILSFQGDETLPVSAVTNNSAEVVPGSIFCAIRGAKTDGHRFLPDACRKGACAVVVSEKDAEIPEGVAVIRVSDSYRAWGLLCETFFMEPAKNMDVFAVTGTNGKTSIAFMLRRIFREAFPGHCGLLSTVEYDTGADCEEAARTTPDAFAFQRLFAEMRQNRCRRAVIEASSHGLHQRRTGSLKFAGAVFTNLTGDHLDYHETMEAYFQAKKSLFSEMLRPVAPAVVNADDPWGKRLLSELDGDRLYGVSLRNDPQARIPVSEIELSSGGVRFTLGTGRTSLHLKSVLIGEHNVCNLALAASLALASGVDGALLEKVLASPDIAPPGRLEPFDFPDGIRAFVDYAHTDDALFRVLSAVRAFAPARVITVFGCGGDRDRTKRPRMAAVVSKLSDFSVITSDNPRTENPLAILREIEAGILPPARYEVEPDRREAIRKAVSAARPGDLVLIAGKGHENYQEINGVKHPFDDREVLRSLQQKLYGKE